MVSITVSPAVSSAKLSLSLQHIDEAIPAICDRLCHSGTRVKLEIKVHGWRTSAHRGLCVERERESK